MILPARHKANLAWDLPTIAGGLIGLSAVAGAAICWAVARWLK